MPHTRSLARIQLVAAAVLFSTGGAAIKWVHFSGVQVAGLRSGIAGLAILALVPAARRGWTWRVIPVGAAYAATLVLYVLANKLTTSANTIFLQSTAPLYLLVLSPWLLRERIRRGDITFMLAVGAGLALFFLGTQPPLVTAPDPARGNLLAAFSGVTWALTVCGLRWLSAHVPAPSAGKSEVTDASAIRAVVAGNFLAAAACLPWGFPLGTHSTGDWAIVLYLGIFQIGVAYLMVTAGLRLVPALEAAVLLLVEPALNPVWSWLVQGEVPAFWTLVGGAIILGSTLIKTWFDARAATVKVS
ncbi:MAG TPA: DMT family transporter [Gemmatimonadales bacterium]|nr:DMT family transporter [Gemmatimonadales bacterium]